MAKKSKDYKEYKGNKGNRGNKETKTSTSMQPIGQQSLEQKFNQGRGNKQEVDKWLKGQANGLEEGQSSQDVSFPEAQDGEGIELPEVLPTKKSCLPKLVVLLMPLVAIGAYLVSRVLN